MEERNYVGDGLGDIRERMVWGGRGRIMEANIEDLLEKWKGTWTGEGWEDLELRIRE